jgi:hypothetical protein
MIEILKTKHVWNGFKGWRPYDLLGMSLDGSVHRPHGFGFK